MSRGAAAERHRAVDEPHAEAPARRACGSAARAGRARACAHAPRRGAAVARALSADGTTIPGGPGAQSLTRSSADAGGAAPTTAWWGRCAASAQDRYTRAPKGLKLAFVSEGRGARLELRDGRVDLDLGVLDDSAPELGTQTLLRDRFVARCGLPPAGSAASSASAAHPVSAHRRLAARPLFRTLDRARCKAWAAPSGGRHRAFGHRGGGRGGGVGSCDHGAEPRGRDASRKSWGGCGYPLALPEIAISQTWHLRCDNDPGHRWLRAGGLAIVKEVSLAAASVPGAEASQITPPRRSEPSGNRSAKLICLQGCSLALPCWRLRRHLVSSGEPGPLL